MGIPRIVADENHRPSFFLQISNEIGLPVGVIVGMDSKWDKSEIHWVSIRNENGKIIRAILVKLSQKKLGFLVNFHVPLIKDGIKRFVNNF